MQNYLSFPSPIEIKKIFPLHEKEKKQIEKFRQQAKNIFTQKDPKIALFVGPCSVHDKSILFYATKLHQLQKKLHNFFIVLRFYPEKSRTKNSWKGFLYDPYLDGSNAMERAILHVRQLLIECTQMNIACCTEWLSPYFVPYLEDLITWGFIGARTVNSQPHRELASSLSMPVGFKNSVEGNISSAINAVEVARAPHTFLTTGSSGQLVKVRSSGNPLTHIVLRGGDRKTNYDFSSIQDTLLLMKKRNLFSPLVIDCAHGNCHKEIEKQKKCFISTIQTMAEYPQLPIQGIMLESFLVEGKQNHSSSLLWGKSVTDPCLGWSSTEKVLLWADDFLSKVMSSVQN